MAEPILRARQLEVCFPLPAAWPWQKAGSLRAVDGVSLDLYAKRTLGLVGESGCGKSTLARALTGMAPITAGTLRLGQRDMTAGSRRAWRCLRRDVQMIFQDPLASLDPRMTAGQIVAEPLAYLRRDLSRAARRARVQATLEAVGLSPAHSSRYAHEFSGGQCQRIGIARALVVEPRVLICDEPVSSLDVSIAARIVELLTALQAERDIAILFIAHDLAVVRAISDDIRVMYLGRLVESAPAARLFARPMHPYTRALLSAVPHPDPRGRHRRKRIRLAGDLPSPASPPGGCVFHTRCPWARADCAVRVPALRLLTGQTRVACHYAEAIAADEAAAVGDRV